MFGCKMFLPSPFVCTWISLMCANIKGANTLSRVMSLGESLAAIGEFMVWIADSAYNIYISIADCQCTSKIFISCLLVPISVSSRFVF